MGVMQGMEDEAMPPRSCNTPMLVVHSGWHGPAPQQSGSHPHANRVLWGLDVSPGNQQLGEPGPCPPTAPRASCASQHPNKELSSSRAPAACAASPACAMEGPGDRGGVGVPARPGSGCLPKLLGPSQTHGSLGYSWVHGALLGPSRTHGSLGHSWFPSPFPGSPPELLGPSRSPRSFPNAWVIPGRLDPSRSPGSLPEHLDHT